MITRVLDDDGRVIHDCATEPCAVSWDGIVLDANAYEQGLVIANGGPVSPAALVAQGKPVPRAAQPDVSVWRVDGDTARRRRVSA